MYEQKILCLKFKFIFQLNDEQLAKKLQEEENNFRSRPRSVKRVPVSKDA